MRMAAVFHIKRTALAAIIVAMAVSAMPRNARAQNGWTGNINFLGGWKLLEDEWRPADEQREGGLQVDLRRENWPVNLAFGFLFGVSGDEAIGLPAGGQVTSESRTTEINGGGRWYWEGLDRWRPFVGGGLSIVNGKLETRGPVGTSTDSDTGLGFWVGAGTLYTLAGWFNVGGQVQYTKGDVDVFGADIDAGGVHIDALIGFAWGP